MQTPSLLSTSYARVGGIYLPNALLKLLRVYVVVIVDMGSDTLPLIELNIVEDFEAILNPEGYFSICGFGSLLSERSARSTFPELRNFRAAILRDFRRISAHTSAVFYDRGIANVDTKEISSLSVEPCPGEHLIVTVFELKKSEVASFMAREPEFRYVAVVPEGFDGIPFPYPAALCASYGNDEEFFRKKCKGSHEIYYQYFGRLNIYKVFREDILPCRVYFRHCILSAKSLSEAAYDNFLEHTFLADRKTTLREYLNGAGSGIMEEKPPESVTGRYDG
ncbi:hypothetical protein AMTR_s00077p00192030 [Amborella trichopoda]|uniref:Uncharacterized protein n=2 Tax=Amborella trichopoda TaxID=13333 RepID=W1P8S4_AMBTC|nr:hypothetical protein AMTR_s00077p00192030 [Amborella trichopoda]